MEQTFPIWYTEDTTRCYYILRNTKWFRVVFPQLRIWKFCRQVRDSWDSSQLGPKRFLEEIGFPFYFLCANNSTSRYPLKIRNKTEFGIILILLFSNNYLKWWDYLPIFLHPSRKIWKNEALFSLKSDFLKRENIFLIYFWWPTLEP